MPNSHEDLGFTPIASKDHSDLGFTSVKSTPESDSTNYLDQAKDLGGSLLKLAGDVASGDVFGINKRLAAGAKPTAAQAGAFQGATLGFGDELEGAAKGLVDAAQGKDLQNSYVDARDAVRQQNRQAQEENPITYGASEFAGGMALPISGMGRVAKATEKLPWILRLLGRTGAAGLEGGALGALSGAGHSEATNQNELINDIAHSAETGAEFGGAIGGTLATGSELGRLGKKGIDWASKYSDSVRRMRDSAQAGNEAELLRVDPQIEKFGKSGERFGEALSSKVKDIKNEFTNAINDFDSSGNSIDFTDRMKLINRKAEELLAVTKDPDEIREINDVVNKVKNYIQLPYIKSTPVTRMVPGKTPIDTSGGLLTPPEPEMIPVTMNQFEYVPGNTELSAAQAKSLESNIGNMAFGENGVQTSGGRNMSMYAKTGISDDVGAVPYLQDTNAKYRKMNQVANELGLDLDQLKSEDFGAGNTLKTKLFNKIIQLVEGTEANGTRSLTADKKIENIFDALNEVDPGLATEFKGELSKRAKMLNLSKEIQGGSIYSPNSWGKKGIPKLLNLAGLANNKLHTSGAYSNLSTLLKGTASSGIQQASKPEQTSNKPEQTSKDAYKLDETQLGSLSSQLMSDPTLQADGAALQKALSTNNSISKNAVIFNLLQKPRGREILRSMGGNINGLVK